jgi:membrane protein involved in D-alanine export
VTPYVDFSYFLFLLYPLAALGVLGMLGLLRRPAVLVVGLAIVCFQYADPLGIDGAAYAGLGQLAFLAAYATVSTAVVLAYARLRTRSHASQPIFYAAIALVLSPLVVVKIAPLAHGVFHASPVGGTHPLAAVPAVVAPTATGFLDTFGFLGISYMTLRVIDALIVLHDGVVTGMPRAADVVSYLLFAPTMSAGPIDRFHRFATALDALPRSRREYLQDIEAGIHRIAQGFLYKFILAYLIYQRALAPMAARSGVRAGVAYMYAFSLYLFFDFAGYSAFAIGVGRFFGIQVAENFNAPFVSRSFREMWDRWHITLSWWMRDHVYMRFMLNAARRRWFAGNRQRAHHVALLLTMTLMGCWHGLQPQYVVYGVYQGLMLVAYDVFDRRRGRRPSGDDGPLTTVVRILVTVNLFCFGLLIFSGWLFA